jgi:hypothetical protein
VFYLLHGVYAPDSRNRENPDKARQIQAATPNKLADPRALGSIRVPTGLETSGISEPDASEGVPAVRPVRSALRII